MRKICDSRDSLLIFDEVQTGLARTGEWFAWQHYVYAPWTRDARVQADVVNVAPEVSGTITEVAVRDDRYVEAGDPLVIVEAMKMEFAVDAPCAGTVKALRCKQGTLVSAGDVLLVIEAD